MKLVKVGVGVLNQTPLAWAHNRDNIIAAIDDARSRGVSLLCLPELCVTGYGCQDAFHSPSVQQMALDVLCDEILPATHGIAVTLGLPILFRNALFNAAVLVSDGEIHGFVCKRYLAGDGVHYEPRWFKPWQAGARATRTLRGREVPIGDVYFDLDGVRVGFEICEDAWVASRPGSQMAGRGVDIIVNPSASHFAFGKLATRERFVIEGSRAFGVTYMYSNLLGNDAGRIVYDGGALIATQGRLVAAGPRFGFEDFTVTTAVIDVEQTRMIQTWTNSFRPRFDVAPDERVPVAFTFPRLEPERPQGPAPEGSNRVPRGPLDPPPLHPAGAGWERSPWLKEEEFTRAVTLALFDYMRRSYSRGFVISLSGGADSTACACLVALMVHRAVAALGLDGVKRRLAYDAGLADADSAEAIIERLLLCVYQSTRNSGDVTLNAAQDVAREIGATFMHLDVDTIVGAYTGVVEQAIGRELTWARDDIALQNIQARVRAPSVWMLANLRGALLVSTSNRSEAAVGYATMDGDTAGGISPIAGIDKAFLRRWLRWLEETGPEGMAPMPVVRAVNVQQPTAELRPPDQAQTDEGDLMPYDLLDAIERCAIRDKQDPLETFLFVRTEFPQYEPRQLGAWVERFFVLWCRNQWKRERYAPSFHVDDENLDPKTWCRFPILSSGFARELADLRAHIAERYPA